MSEVETNMNTAAGANEPAKIEGTAFTFHFKKRKILNEQGEAIGTTKKQPSLTLGVKTPTAADLVAMLEAGGAVSALVLTAVQQVIYQQARAQFDEVIEGFGADQEKTVSANDLDHSKLTLEYIASIPPTQRGGSAISEEDWAEWYKHYTAVMAEATGKEATKLAKHVEIFKSPQRYKNNKEVLAVMLEQLDLYMAAAGDALEDYEECATRMKQKFHKWYTTDEKASNLLDLI